MKTNDRIGLSDGKHFWTGLLKLPIIIVLATGVMNLTLRAADDVSLYICDSNGNVGFIDLTAGTVIDLGAEGSGLELHDLAYVPSTGMLFGTSHTAFYQVSTLTGASTEIGAYNGLGGSEMDGLVTDGTYFLGSTGADSDIYKIVAAPYSVAKLPGSVGGESAGDLAYSSNGTLYDAVLAGGVGELWTVNFSSNGVVSGSEIGDFSQGLGIVGMALGSDGVLYGVDKTEVYSIDTSNAHLTPLFDFAGHGLSNAEGLTAVVRPAPEPASIWLVAVGGLGLVFWRKLKWVHAA